MSWREPEARRCVVLCAGIAVLDQVFRVERFPVPEAKTRATDFVTVSGGNAGNAAIAIARLGGRAALAAPLGGPAGDDTVGDRILAYLEDETIDCAACVRIVGARSPISAIVVDARGERTIVNHRDEALIRARVADPVRLASTADVVLADNRFPEFVLPICAAARASKRPVVLDFDQPTRETDALLALGSHVVFSAEGLRATADREDLAAALRHIRDRTDAFLAVTDGAHDMICLHGTTCERLPTFAVEAIDTLGAGDVFHGAYALALAEGHDAIEAMRFAAAAGAAKCMQFGGIAGAPERRHVAALLAGAGRVP
ncbi:MAG TPA: PfkB family carbohydrate kinase [Xanthobacteraceae bacterium]|nr:PfkB family carbohydrate kinase [Xanthobacteraceae bacterium]